MDAFSYLSVLLSIILGLAVTQVLQGVRGLLLSRATVKLYAPSLIWSGSLLLMAVQQWWASFGLRARGEWSFADFSMVLLQTVLFYLWSGLALPDMRPKEPLDLREHYHRERPWFFALGAATLLISLLKDLVLEGHFPGAENVAFHLAIMTLFSVAAVWRREWFHQLTAPLALLAMGGYVAALFAQL